MTTVSRPPSRQLAMVFDLNKCLGCQSCTVACKTLWTDAPGMEAMWWNIVNTMPGRGTPKDAFEHGGGYRDGAPVPGAFPSLKEYGEAWDFDHAAVFEGNERIPLHPIGKDGKAPDWGPNWDEDMGGGVYPNSYFFYLQQICANCSKPACLEACPRESLYRREEDGIILIDEERCHGYRFCAEACPYKRIYFNSQRAVAQKCIGCYPRIEQGVAPACVRQCPGRARHIDYMENRDGHAYKLVHEWKVALPLRADFGTEPNVFYVPPLSPPAFNERGEFVDDTSRIPIAYLRELFGEGVDAALDTITAERAKTTRGESSELMDLLIARDWNDLMGPFTANPAELDRPPAVR